MSHETILILSLSQITAVDYKINSLTNFSVFIDRIGILRSDFVIWIAKLNIDTYLLRRQIREQHLDEFLAVTFDKRFALVCEIFWQFVTQLVQSFLDASLDLKKINR